MSYDRTLTRLEISIALFVENLNLSIGCHSRSGGFGSSFKELFTFVFTKSSTKSFTKLLQNGRFDEISLNKFSNIVYKYPQFKELFTFVFTKSFTKLFTKSFSPLQNGFKSLFVSAIVFSRSRSRS